MTERPPMRDDIPDRVVRLEEKTHNLDTVMTGLSERFIQHMDKEERSFNNLYERLRNIDKELQKAFKERDEAIASLDKRLIRLVSYATAGFAVISLLIQVAVKHI